MKYVEGFEERNPNLKLIGAYIHMDEASPHLHLDYVPVATGYSRGLETRNSLDKAMKQMGFQPESESRKNNATKLWKENERAVFGQICRGLGLEVVPERKSERKSLTVDEYKEARDEMIGEIEQEKEAIIAEVEPLRELKTGIDEIDTTGKKLPFGVVAIKEKDLEAVKEQAKAYTANRDEIGELRQRSAAVFQREQRADQRERQLDNKANELAKQQQQLQQMYQRQLKPSCISLGYWDIVEVQMGALPPADLLRYSEAGGNPQSSSPFEKGGRTPSLNFTLGALPQTPHSPCGRRERRVAFPSARAVCRSVPSRDG